MSFRISHSKLRRSKNVEATNRNVFVTRSVPASTLASGGWNFAYTVAIERYTASVEGGPLTDQTWAYGQPFARLLDLKRGDEVIVETREAVYTYMLDDSPRQLTVKDSDTWVIDPVPGKPGHSGLRVGSVFVVTTNPSRKSSAIRPRCRTGG